MNHIQFNLQEWLDNNPDGTFSTLREAIASAPKVFSGWTVADAEKIRKRDYSDRSDLSIEDSRIVVREAAATLDAHEFIPQHLSLYYEHRIEDIFNMDETQEILPA